ncbi:acetyl/propionyl/methylcrotonyl-CoA carboxylase subunit alpha [Tomitella fengzijianii]|uniref:biotin carboxylase n=1 Tax=Tomitella fengzijianii TaxID=2597660 RepID=A0A516X7H5_9ACTN|nr:biotin carboxylase N-terminal domain-containing protein [Tomitella fengzijianii]QDQ99000.1 acetyl/propionyl-CoA carboxylase subunit alpha [Tomitella fengzijianii]
MSSSAPVSTVLVANRGEIARRVFATARRTGRGTAAVYSDADADAPHVREADSAVRLPGEAPGETYLRADLLVAAARAAGADAVHPGYGFLSENADFARAVVDAGLTWIGPPAAAIELMGSKVESKKRMAESGVPVLEQLEPGAVTEDQLPVLIKASAGGGGRGMRVVRALADLRPQIEAARAEAASAFGDSTVFCERYLETGRHIEVQVMADAHGTVLALGERECSIQRRHQKVVEEAPSPLVERIDGAGGDMRARLFDAARQAASVIGYEGAGTVEFLADEQGRFYFLEMNTRLQVEHPVTEMTTGMDLVEMQFRAAEGARFGEDAQPTAARGHAIEVRLYAEDPAAEWQPQSGTARRFSVPGVTARFSVPADERGLRLDSGIEDGSVVGVHYDAMLAKVIAWAPSRGEAARILAAALARARIHGLVTNRDLLVNILRHPAFLAGETDTAFFGRHGLDTLSASLAGAGDERVSALAAALAQAAANRASARVVPGLPSGWRNVASQHQRKDFRGAHGTHEVDYRLTRDGLATGFVDGVGLVSASPDQVVLTVDGLRREYAVARYGGGPPSWDRVHVDSSSGPCAFEAVPRFVDPSEAQAAGSLLAPMPGTVIRLGAAVGDTVAAGQPVLWLEAMKMEHAIAAPADGVVAEIGVGAGDQVEVGAVLAVVAGPQEAAEPESAEPGDTRQTGEQA